MDAPIDPPLQHLLSVLNEELVLAQVLIRRQETGFELRHLSDRSRPVLELSLVPGSECRGLLQFDARGAFRPLSTAPSLVAGWRVEARDAVELGEILEKIYPGALADVF